MSQCRLASVKRGERNTTTSVYAEDQATGEMDSDDRPVSWQCAQIEVNPRGPDRGAPKRYVPDRMCSSPAVPRVWPAVHPCLWHREEAQLSSQHAVSSDQTGAPGAIIGAGLKPVGSDLRPTTREVVLMPCRSGRVDRSQTDLNHEPFKNSQEVFAMDLLRPLPRVHLVGAQSQWVLSSGKLISRDHFGVTWNCIARFSGIRTSVLPPTAPDCSCPSCQRNADLAGFGDPREPPKSGEMCLKRLKQSQCMPPHCCASAARPSGTAATPRPELRRSRRRHLGMPTVSPESSLLVALQSGCFPVAVDLSKHDPVDPVAW